MAKRKRLIPSLVPQAFGSDIAEIAPVLETKAFLRPGLGGGSVPPIARVAGETAAQAALEEVTAVLAKARAEGRLVQALPLNTIDMGHLVRDRITVDQEELNHLIGSIRDHGQRSPIEVTDLGDGRYGLISGWRRMQALQHLSDTTGGAEFGTVLALLRQPTEASDAYIAMVEENEVRQGLSYYERARIAARAVELGVFETEKQALQRLFAAASRSRRSKIGSFLAIYHALDGSLRFPASIPERLGLSLAKLLAESPEAADTMQQTLVADPPETAEAELALLAECVTPRQKGSVSAEKPDSSPSERRHEVRPGVFLEVSGGARKPVLTLSGPSVGPGFVEQLKRWLAAGS